MPELCCLSPHYTCGKPGFTSSACGTFTKITETIKKKQKIDQKKKKCIYDEAIIAKSFDVETSTYINFEVKNNDKNPQLSIHDYVGISKYKNVFAKVNTPT